MMDEASSILSQSTSESLEWVAVGKEAELKEKRRKTLEVSDRKVTIFFQDGRFYVLDFHCYREYNVDGFLRSGMPDMVFILIIVLIIWMRICKMLMRL